MRPVPSAGIDKSTWASEGGGRLTNWTLRRLTFAGATQNSTILGAAARANGTNCSIDEMRLRDFEISGHVASSAEAARVQVEGSACAVKFSPR